MRSLAATCLFITAFTQPGFAAAIIFAGALRGAGDTIWVMMLNLATVIGIRLTGAIIVGYDTSSLVLARSGLCWLPNSPSAACSFSFASSTAAGATPAYNPAMGLTNIDIGSAMRRLADRRIEEAMREGKFDNLAGAGKELNLDPMPAEENARMTWWCLRIMRNNDFTPHEIQHRKAIDHLKARLAQAPH